MPTAVFRSLRKPASKSQVERLGKQLPMALPMDLVRSLEVHDGLRNSYLGPVRLFNYWALLPLSAVREVWRMQCELQAQDEVGGCPLTRTRAIKNDVWWREGWVPFMDADGDRLLIDLDPGPEGRVGQVIQLYNSGGRPRRVIAPSYRAWLSALADRLGGRTFHLDEWGGIWLDDLSLG